MSRKTPHLTEHTVGQIEEWFEEIFGEGTYNVDRARRLRKIPVDGVPLARRYAELRSPQSNFYAKSFVEAREVLNMIVDLQIDADVANVVRRDGPDVEVQFSGRPPLYVEQSSIMAEGTPFHRHLEEARLALLGLSIENPPLRKFLESGWFNVRLTDPGLTRRVKSTSLASEVTALSSEIRGEVTLFSPDSAKYPTLALYHANVTYKPGQLSSGLIFQENAGAFDPVPRWIIPRILAALDAKKAKAARYDPALRPLWLLLSLDPFDVVMTPFLRPEVESALIGAEIKPFDRLIVMMPGMQPIVVDRR